MVSTLSFLSLPSEIRLSVYNLLLTSQESKVISIRTLDAVAFEKAGRTPRTRTTYRIMSGRFRVRSIETTYCLIGNHGLSTSILGVNKQIHREGCHVLYSSHVFDFDKNVESIIPFFGDLTPIALLSVRRISIVQRALPYIKEFDRCEWRSVCKFIARNLELDHLVLGVLGGVPESRWVVEDPIEKTAFRHITRIEGMEWVTELAAIKGLRNLDVKAYMEHCPPPQSIAMAFFVNFSASIETGFAEYLRELMIIASA